MQNNTIWFDGTFLPYSEALCSPLSHSLCYGTSVYEGMRSYKGNIFYLNEHLARFQRSAEIFGIRLSYSLNEIRDVAYELMNRNQFIDCYIKMILFLDDADPSFMARDCNSRLFMTVYPIKQVYNKDEIALHIASWKRPSNACHPYQAKTSSTYTLSYLAYRAKPDEFDDVLFLTESGSICESSGANIFFIKDNILVTPRIDTCLDGITRNVIINKLAPQLNLTVEVRDIDVNELDSFDGAFVCGTAVEIKSVTRIDNVLYKNQQLTMNLIHAYYALVYKKNIVRPGRQKNSILKIQSFN